MRNIDSKQVKYVTKNLDLGVIDIEVKEAFGYNTDWTCHVNEANSGQAHDNSKPGFVFLGSDYVGKIVQDEASKRYFFHMDRGDQDEYFILNRKAKEEVKPEQSGVTSIDQLIPAFDQGAVTNPESTQTGVAKMREALDNSKEKDMPSNTQEAPVLTANVFYCNVWTKDAKTVYYFNQKWMNVSRTRDDLVARAEGVLGTTQAKSRNKAIVLQIGDKWVVITKVVKDGQLVTKSVFADEMDLRQNKR